MQPWKWALALRLMPMHGFLWTCPLTLPYPDRRLDVTASSFGPYLSGGMGRRQRG